MKRKEGYYWTRIDEDWYVCEWEYRSDKKYRWTFHGSSQRFDDDHFDEINENRIKAPNE